MHLHRTRRVSAIVLAVLLIVPVGTPASASARRLGSVARRGKDVLPASDADALNPDATESVPSARLFFAPAIDADGDASTNPAAGEPVLAHDVLGRVAARFSLAAQLEARAPAASAIGTPVTFRLWDERGGEQRRVATSDAWGAVVASFVVTETSGEFSYQATAPGYEATELRRFRIDPSRRSLVVRADGARLSYSRPADGMLSVRVWSPYPLDAGETDASLIIARRPDQAPAQLDALLDPLGASRPLDLPYLPFPPVAMRVTGLHEAQIDVALPAGDYALLGAFVLVSGPGHDSVARRVFYSQRETLRIERDGAPSHATRAASVVMLPHELGKRLVRFETEPGRAVFGLLNASDAAELTLVEPPPTSFARRRRVGPFTAEEVAIQTNTTVFEDDGRKRAWLADVSVTPLGRRYTVAVQALEDGVITDTLRIDVRGPGGVVLAHEETVVALRRDRPTLREIALPSGSAAPQAIQVALDDPLRLEFRLTETRTLMPAVPESIVGAVGGFFRSLIDDLAWPFKQMWQWFKRHGQVDGFNYTVSAHIIGFTLIEFAYPDNAEWNWFPERDPETVFWDVLDYIGLSLLDLDEVIKNQRIEIGAGSVQIGIGASLGFNFLPKCIDDAEAARTEMDAAKRAANELLTFVNENEYLKASVKSPFVPLVFALGLWGVLETSYALGVDADDASYTLSIGANPNVTMKLSTGFGLPWPNLQFIRYAAGVSLAVTHAYRLMTSLEARHRRYGSGGECRGWRGSPDGTPADDRQDVWNDVTQLIDTDDSDESIDALSQLVERANGLGLTRASALLTYDLRVAERSRFLSDAAALNTALDESMAAYDDAALDIRGMLSGTVPLSPTGSITLSIQARVDEMEGLISALPYNVSGRLLDAAASQAERDYDLLFGQELELQRELQVLLTSDTIGVLAVGFSGASIFALRQAGLPHQLISLFPGGDIVGGQVAPYMPPDIAPRALVVPSAGMYPIMQSQEARAWLEQYVRGGGLLIVFTQAFDEDWAALPGGQVRGVGYAQDQRCEHDSVRAGMPSPWLMWMAKATPDLQVDGAFTQWPADADVLLYRTSGAYLGYPALIDYPLGEGRVLATTAYGDWAVSTAIYWGDDWAFTRSILIRAWLRMHGQDVGDSAAAAPGASFVAAIPMTNTSPVTMTRAAAGFNVLPSRLGPYQTSYETTTQLAPGGALTLEAPFVAPPLFRQTDALHSWSRAGLYRYWTVVTADRVRVFSWDGFVAITSPVVISDVVVGLQAEAPAVWLNQAVQVTATVRNFDSAVHTVVLRGESNLPATPYTLTLSPGMSATQTYAVVMNASKLVRVAISDTSGSRLNTASLALYVAPPRLRVGMSPLILQHGQPVTLTVRNRPLLWQPASASPTATVRLTITSASGAVVLGAQQDVPPIPSAATADVGLPLTATLDDAGGYVLSATVSVNGQVVDTAGWSVEPHLSLGGAFAPAAARIREAGAFTLSVQSAGVGGLVLPVTLSLPALGLLHAGVVTVGLFGGAGFAMGWSVPETLTAGAYPLYARIGGSTAVSATFGLVVLPSRVEASAFSSGIFAAGSSVSFTLGNTGGQDATGAYTATLRDAYGVRVSVFTGTRGLLAGESTSVSLSLPGLAAQGKYWLGVNARNDQTGEVIVGGGSFTVTGMSAALGTRTDQPEYPAGAPVEAQATLTATSSAVTGTVSLSIANDAPVAVTAGPREQANDDSEPGDIYHRDVAVAADAAGNVYAVWEDGRDYKIFTGTFENIYFAWRSPVSATWSPNERVAPADTSTCTDSQADLAVDPAGGAYAIWNCNDTDIYFAHRPPAGTWGPRELVNTVAVTTQRSLPSIAVDAAGNSYAVWRDWRDGGRGGVYFSRRPSGGAWLTNTLVFTIPSTVFLYDAQIAADAAGNAFILWADDHIFGKQNLYAMSRDVSGTFGLVEVIGNATLTNIIPSLTVDSSGAPHVAWMSKDNAFKPNLLYSRRTVTGTWTAPVIAFNPGLVPFDRVDIAVSGDYTPVIAFSQPANYSVRVTQRSAAGTWLAPTTPYTYAGLRLRPAIAIAPVGDVHAAWWRTASTNPNGNGAIWASTRPLTGSAWVAPVKLNDDVGGAVQRVPALATDSAGNDYATWLGAIEDGTKDAVYFARRDAISGTWSVNEQLNAIHAGGVFSDVEQHDIAVNATGLAYAVWQEAGGTGTRRMYGAMRSITGTWGPNELLPYVNDDGSAPKLVMDDGGSVFVAFTGYGAATRQDAFVAQRTPAGVWLSATQLNDYTPGYQGNPSIALDTSGTVHAAWEETRTVHSVYYSSRLPGSTWSTPERVDAGLIYTVTVNEPSPDPVVAADAAGNVAVLWSHYATPFPEFNWRLRFASKPFGGGWSPSTILAATSSTEPYRNMLFDPAGNLFVLQTDLGGYRLFVRTADGVWQPEMGVGAQYAGGPAMRSIQGGEVRLAHSDLNADGPGPDNRDIFYRKLILSGGGQELWSASAPADTSATQLVTAAAGTLGGLPGKYRLSAVVVNPLSQTLATARSSFHIHPAGTALTIKTDKDIYQPNQPVVVTGRVTNTGGATAVMTVTVRAAGSLLINTAFTLTPGAGAPFTGSFASMVSVPVSATAGAATVYQNVAVQGPQLLGRLSAPASVVAPFTATLTLTNTWFLPLDVAARIGSHAPESLTIPAGQTVDVVQEAGAWTSVPGALQASVTGYAPLSITHPVTWAAAAALDIWPPVSPASGPIAFAYVLTGTGSLPFDGVLTWMVDGSPVGGQLMAAPATAGPFEPEVSVAPASLSVAPGAMVAGQSVLDLPAGLHTVRATLADVYGNVVVSTTRTTTVTAPAMDQAAPRIAGLRTFTSTSTVVVTVTNSGDASEPTVLSAQLFNVPQQQIITPSAGATSVYTFSMAPPADMPGGVYVGEVVLDEQRAPFTMTRRAAMLTMTLATNKVTYEPGERLTLSMRLTESAGVAGTYNLWLRYGDDDGFITTTVGAGARVTQTHVFTAHPADDRIGVGLAYTPTFGQTAARTIVFDSIAVRVTDRSSGAWLSFNKAMPYAAGETIFYTATITGTFNTVLVHPPTSEMAAYSNSLAWTAPTTNGQVITGSHPLTFTLPPDVQTGRYAFGLLADQHVGVEEVDVRGVTVLVRRASLVDRPRIKLDVITGTVEFDNQGSTAAGLRLAAKVERPDTGDLIELSPVVSRLITLTPGLNVVVVTGTYSTPVVGLHRLRVDLRKPSSPRRLSGAMMQFDVGSAHLVGLSSDQGNYAVGEQGIGRLDAFGFGPTQLLVTVTTGATAFSATAALNGFAVFTFPIPTDALGDRVLVARLIDMAGNADSLPRAYAIVQPPDVTPPLITVTAPSTTTVIASAAPTLTIWVEGTASDERGAVSVSANGRVTTSPIFSLPVTLRQGFNLVTVSAVDPSGNYVLAAPRVVLVQPAHSVSLSASPSPARPGERVTFTLSLAASADVLESSATLALSGAVVTDVAALATTGGASTGASMTSVWTGGVLSTAFSRVQVGAAPQQTGTLTATAAVLWGFGAIEQRVVAVEVTTERRVYLPSTRRGGGAEW